LSAPYFAAGCYRELACPAVKTANCLRTNRTGVFAVQQGMPYSLSNGANQVLTTRTDRHGSMDSQVPEFRIHSPQMASGKRVSRSSPASLTTQVFSMPTTPLPGSTTLDFKANESCQI